VLRALCNYANVNPNPASSPKKRRSGSEKSFLFDVGRKRTYIRRADMPAWWSAVSSLSGLRTDSGAADASDLLRLMLLTGLRAGEACGLEWEHVSVRDGIIVIPDPKNREPHELPLGRLLHGIIRDRAEMQRGRYVFPAPMKPGAHYNYNTLRGWFDLVAAESGVKVTAHDLRRTFATIAEGLDISMFAVKRLLNHRTGRSDVTEGYIGLDVERLRGAMQRIEDEILRQAAESEK
jgi:integrase